MRRLQRKTLPQCKCAQARQDSDGIWYIWMSILLGPVGCLLRWQLGKNFNGKFGWFPWGTWAANVGACLLDFTCQVWMGSVKLTRGPFYLT